MGERIPTMGWRWNGETMEPLAPKLADRHLVIGETYLLQPGRSRKSHNHFFAVVQRAWENLPESIAKEFPTAEHLRARALIELGYSLTRSCPTADEEMALRVAGFMGPSHPFSVIAVQGNMVVEVVPMSQSLEGMDAETFAQSKKDVLEYLSALIGVSVEELSKSAKGDAQ